MTMRRYAIAAALIAWACTPPPDGTNSIVGNIHANRNGYAVIASTFNRVIGRLR